MCMGKRNRLLLSLKNFPIFFFIAKLSSSINKSIVHSWTSRLAIILFCLLNSQEIKTKFSWYIHLPLYHYNVTTQSASPYFIFKRVWIMMIAHAYLWFLTKICIGKPSLINNYIRSSRFSVICNCGYRRCQDHPSDRLGFRTRIKNIKGSLYCRVK